MFIKFFCRKKKFINNPNNNNPKKYFELRALGQNFYAHFLNYINYKVLTFSPLTLNIKKKLFIHSLSYSLSRAQHHRFAHLSKQLRNKNNKKKTSPILLLFIRFVSFIELTCGRAVALARCNFFLC